MNEHSMDESNLPVIEQSAEQRPRVWTVFVALFLALLLALLLQACFGGVLAAIEISRGVKPQDLEEAITSKLADPYLFMMIAAMGQLAFAIAALLPALCSPEPFRERIAWAKPFPSWHVYPIAMLSSIVPLAVGLLSAQAMAKVVPADESVAKVFAAMTINSAIVFVLFIGIVPGFVEEVLFRGYMQQRLMKRWGAATAIIVTSILFSLVHVAPHAIAAVVPLGFWFGYLAWRSKSILPTILCHFFVNSGLNAWRMINQFGDLSEIAQNVVHVSAVVIGIICFVICCLPAFWRKGAAAKPSSTEA